MNAYILLAVAIVSEVFSSSLLKATNGFRKIMPSLGVMIGMVWPFTLYQYR